MNRHCLPLSSCVFTILFALGSLSCSVTQPYPQAPGLTIAAPNERTFYIPSEEEPLPVVVIFPDGMAADSPISDIELLNAEGKVVYTRGGPAVAGPTEKFGERFGQLQAVNPLGVVPGWYTLKIYGKEAWGKSAQFRISGLGTDDDHAITVEVPRESAIRPGGRLRLSWKAWGQSCNPADGYAVILFRNGSHGKTHSQWILETKTMKTQGNFLLPAEIPPSGKYFILIDNGPLCDGTTSLIPTAQ